QWKSSVYADKFHQYPLSEKFFVGPDCLQFLPTRQKILCLVVRDDNRQFAIVAAVYVNSGYVYLIHVTAFCYKDSRHFRCDRLNWLPMPPFQSLLGALSTTKIVIPAVIG